MRDRRIRGSTLRGLRLEGLLDPREVAKGAGITYGFYRNIEGGYDQPGDLTAHKIASFLTEALDREITVKDFSDPKALPRSPRQDNGWHRSEDDEEEDIDDEDARGAA